MACESQELWNCFDFILPLGVEFSGHDLACITKDVCCCFFVEFDHPCETRKIILENIARCVEKMGSPLFSYDNSSLGFNLIFAAAGVQHTDILGNL